MDKATIVIDPSEINEVLFKVQVHGSQASQGNVELRMVCEAGDMSFMFPGRSLGNNDVVAFTVPRVGDRITEGTYDSRIEVLVGGRCFVPVKFKMNVQQQIRVVAEAVETPRTLPGTTHVTASSLGVRTLRERYEERKR